MSKTSIAITGGTGRMGQMVLLETHRSDLAAVSAVLVRDGSPDTGKPVSLPDVEAGVGLDYTEDAKKAFREADVVVDFTTPEASLSFAQMAAETRTPLVIGTTGFSDDQLKEIERLGEKAPILLSYNMSFGINVLAHVLETLSGELGTEFHVKITDIHHKHKKDAPSGTALMMGDALGRSKDHIKFESVREGEVVGEHQIHFAGPGEQIEVIHRAQSRRVFATGALKAALWLKDQKPGFYKMKDVLLKKD